VDDANGVPQDDSQPVEPAGRKRNGATTPTPPQTIGAALLRARDAAGLSLQDVAARTKVRPGILADIEADAHDKLPALTYTLGFVKAYARTVGLDPAEAAERYRRESLKGDPIPTMVDLQPLEAKRLPSKRLTLVATTAIVLLLGLFGAWGAGWLTPPPPAAPDSALIEPAETPAPAAVEVTPTTPASADSSAPVTITAREEVWVRIADGDESFFMGTMAPGQVMSLPPGRAWKLRTGRAGALEVKVGSTVIPPLGGPAEQVRNVSLAPADLLALPQPVAGGLAPTARLDTAAPAAPAPAASAPPPG
jgi:transcriptional regulator with XRE-family HTH domain